MWTSVLQPATKPRILSTGIFQLVMAEILAMSLKKSVSPARKIFSWMSFIVLSSTRSCLLLSNPKNTPGPQLLKFTGLVRSARPIPMKLLAPRNESLLLYRLAHCFGKFKVVMQVVNRV